MPPRLETVSVAGRLGLLGVLLLLLGPCQAVAPEIRYTDVITQPVLEAKIQEIEADADIAPEARDKLVDLYRKALSNLQASAANEQAAEAFRRAAQSAPAEIEALRRGMEKAESRDPEASLQLDPDTTLRQLDQLLQKEKADRAAVDARRADFEERLEEEAGRPMLIHQRLIEAGRQQQEVADQLRLQPLADDGPATAEARRWVLQTHSDAISSEIRMLDQELLSQPMRLDLLKAKRDKAANSVQWTGTRMRLLESLANAQRLAEAEQARAEADAIRDEAKGKHPLVVALAEQNASLSEDMAEMSARLTALAERVEETAELGRRIERDFKNAQTSVEVGGLSQRLGQMLQTQRRSMPDQQDYRRAVKERAAQATEIGLQRLQHQEEEGQLRVLDQYLDGLLAAAGEGATSELRGELRALAQSRRELLREAIDADDLFLRKLAELESAQSRLLSALTEYDAFLDEKLLWVRSDSMLQLATSGDGLARMRRVLDPVGWSEIPRVLAHQALNAPWLALVVLVVAVLLWGRGRLLQRVREFRPKLGKVTTDSFGYSVRALLLTLIAAAPWPLGLAAIGWQLQVSSVASDFGIAVGASLVVFAVQFYYLRAFRWICMPDGLASHFRWPAAALELLRRELERLTWVFLPAALVAVLAVRLDPLDAGGWVGRVAFLVAAFSLALSLFRLLHPRDGALAEYMRNAQRSGFRRLHRFWYPLVIAYAPGMGGLALLGYLNAAGKSISLFLETAWFALELLVIAGLAKRWLLVTRRRLVYEAALERRQAEQEAKRAEAESGGPDAGGLCEPDEPDVDLVSLSDKSRRLLYTGVLVYGLFGLWAIWSDVFPALRILDRVTLWHHSVLVDGETQLQAVTLATLGLALIYVVFTILLARQLPAVLEIMLLHSTEADAGTRYTVTTLANYAIVTTGAVLVFQTIGVDWSRLQWLVAALGVGIGFGLQEIVANFISGIIILFERPVRIGDVITVGDTDGVVTRIRSRATTIRNWDGKELLVPNKEFITGRLLNWSLSDQTTRVIISVGIAYGSNVRQAMDLLREAARENEAVLDDPQPSVIFESFGDNSLALLLRCFVDNAELRYPTISALNEAINDKFNNAGIVIAFPQRDLHLDTSQPLQVELRNITGGSSSAGEAG